MFVVSDKTIMFRVFSAIIVDRVISGRGSLCILVGGGREQGHPASPYLPVIHRESVPGYGVVMIPTYMVVSHKKGDYADQALTFCSMMVNSTTMNS